MLGIENNANNRRVYRAGLKNYSLNASAMELPQESARIVASCAPNLDGNDSGLRS
jgi:hypothetical protein